MALPSLALRRPVMATVANILVVIGGVAALLNLPVRELPNVDTAEVTVSVDYTGAAPDVIDSQVVTVIEGAIAGISGLKSMDSESERGGSRTVLTFDADRDIDAATNDVRSAVDSVVEDLPEAADPPEIEKNDDQSDPVLRLSLSSTERDSIELSDYASRNIVDRLSRLQGVSNVAIYGERAPAMRVWLDSARMAAYGVTVAEISSALEDNNLERPAGELETDSRQIQVLTRTRFSTPEDFERLVLRAEGDRQVLLADVATIEPGAEDTDSSYRFNGATTVGLGVQQQAQGNTIDIARTVRAELGTIRDQLPPDMNILVQSDESIFISRSIEEVMHVLVEAVVLVALVMLLFMGSLRAAFVPLVTIPISLAGALAGIWIAGFSINTLTLFALILAIGLVVDDAIVVLENIQRRQKGGETREEASLLGANQVSFAVIATTAVLISVFVPISFMEGEVGRLFAEFGIALAIAVAVSSFVSLTFCPVLTARILSRDSRPGRAERAVDWATGKLAAGYRAMLERALDKPTFVIALCVGVTTGAVALYERLPQELTPSEDRGFVVVAMNAPQGANLAYTNRAAEKVEALLDEYRESGIVDGYSTVVGRYGELRRAASFVRLVDWEERATSQDEFLAELRPKLAGIGEAEIRAYGAGGLGGGSGGIDIMVGGSDFAAAAENARALAERMEDYPGLTGIEVDYGANQPGAMIDLDRERARDLGLDAATVAETIQSLVASREVTEYTDRSRQYPVYLQADLSGRDAVGDLGDILLRTDAGELVPISAIATIREEASSPAITRYDRVPSVPIGADLAGDAGLGEVVDFVLRSAGELPAGATIAFTGEAADFVETASGASLVFALALVIVFLTLAAQFENFLDPLVILLSVPLAVTGAFLTLYAFDVSLNIYSQVGLILLVGLMAKNGILLVEFAKQLRAEGYDLREAVLEGSTLRLRPILMTTIATIVGGLPLALATGAGAESRVAIGLVICGGFAFASVLTLFLVPVLYEQVSRATLALMPKSGEKSASPAATA